MKQQAREGSPTLSYQRSPKAPTRSPKYVKRVMASVSDEVIMFSCVVLPFFNNKLR